MATHSSFLPGKSHGQRSLTGYSPSITRVKQDLATKQQQEESKGLRGSNRVMSHY